MNIACFEDHGYRDLLPLTWLRACCELRCGRDRLLDKLRAAVRGPLACLWVREPLQTVVAERIRCESPDPGQPWLVINTRALVTGELTPPAPGTAWRQNGDLVAATLTPEQFERLTAGGCEPETSGAGRRPAPADLFLDPAAVIEHFASFQRADLPEHVRLMRFPWDLISANESELRRQCRTGGVQEGEVSPGAHLVRASEIHVAGGARVKPGAVLDAEEGPVWLDRGALVEPCAVIQGPCYVGPRSIVRPGAALRGGASIGPVCKVGGEIEASIIHGYSNKQHDGFLGHSYIGEWVNLGADTVTSDLKNTYGTIRASLNGVGIETGRHFLGATIGDHSKTGIGTILPTGGIVGVAANVFTSGTVPKFVPSFAWLTDEGLVAYRVDKAVQIARAVMGRRDVELTEADQRLLEHVAAEARKIEAAGWA